MKKRKSVIHATLKKNHFLKALVKAYGRGQQGKMFKNK